MRPIAVLAILMTACSFDGSGPSSLAGQRDAAGVGADSGGRDLPKSTDGAIDGGGSAEGLPTDGPPADRSDGPPPDGPRPDAPARDTSMDTRSYDTTVDTLSPDMTVDSGPLVYLDESFDSGFGELTPYRGNWSWTGDAILQSSDDENGNYVLYDAPTTDVAAETELEIHSIDGRAGVIEFAALLFRVTPGNVGVPPALVGCYLSPDGQRLGIFSCNGINTLCSAIDHVSASVQYNTRYRLVGEVVGTQIRCRLPSQQKEISGVASRMTGDVGVGTFYASATFHSLRVWQP